MRAMARVARAIATATKGALETNGNNTGDGYGKEGSGHLTAGTMAMGMGMVRRKWLLAPQLERGGQWWQWAMVLHKFLCVWRDHKK
jgi:hypothetical protein